MLPLVQPQNVTLTQNVTTNAKCHKRSPKISQLTQSITILTQDVATQNVTLFPSFFAKCHKNLDRTLDQIVLIVGGTELTSGVW